MKRTAAEDVPSPLKKKQRILGPHELDGWEFETSFPETPASPTFFNYIMSRIEFALWKERVYFAGTKPRSIYLFWDTDVSGYANNYDAEYAKIAPRPDTSGVYGTSFRLEVIRTLEASGYHVVVSKPTSARFYLRIGAPVHK